MRIVNDFNKLVQGGHREVLLLSCKAGGEGLNLIGASKIILYDLDWNPATDAQVVIDLSPMAFLTNYGNHRQWLEFGEMVRRVGWLFTG